MTRPPDLHVGALVFLPDGRATTITARQGGPVTLWKTRLDERPVWRDDQLRVPDEDWPAGLSPACAGRRCSSCGGGYMVNRIGHTCTCPCGHLDGPGRRPSARTTPERPWADRHRHGICEGCGAQTSTRTITRCRTCAGLARRKTPTAATAPAARRAMSD